jgi:hypothetical protein
MSLLRPATNTSAFLKMGIMGKQGAGKTKTAGKVAIGLVQHLQKLGIPTPTSRSRSSTPKPAPTSDPGFRGGGHPVQRRQVEDAQGPARSHG